MLEAPLARGAGDAQVDPAVPLRPPSAGEALLLLRARAGRGRGLGDSGRRRRDQDREGDECGDQQPLHAALYPRTLPTFLLTFWPNSRYCLVQNLSLL